MHTLVLVAGEDVARILAPFSSAEVKPHEVALDDDEVQGMASHYGLPVTDRVGLAARIKDYFREDGFEREGRLFRISCENSGQRFDWYEVGGRWGEFLKLKQPRETRRWFGLLAGPAVTHVPSARKSEIDQAQLLAEPPAGLVREGEWRSSPIVLDGPPPAEWKREFANLFAALPDDTLLHCVDIHD